MSGLAGLKIYGGRSRDPTADFFVRKEVIKIVRSVEWQDPILEIGSRQAHGQEQIANLRPMFQEMEYLGCDKQDGPGVDQVVDFEKETDLPLNHFRTLFCLDTLEHVWDFRSFIDSSMRHLVSGGRFLFTSHMRWPIHNHPSDFWRFTPEAFRRLFSPYVDGNVRIISDHNNNPLLVVAMGVKS